MLGRGLNTPSDSITSNYINPFKRQAHKISNNFLNTFKQFVGIYCLSVFDHFVRSALKELIVLYTVNSKANYDVVNSY